MTDIESENIGGENPEPEMWEQWYGSTEPHDMPWFYPGLDPDLEKALNKLGIIGGRFLDLGTGPATQAIALAKRGFDVTGTDISTPAITKARKRADAQNVHVTFILDDILKTKLN